MQFQKKPYPLGTSNPYIVRGIIGSHRWELVHRESRVRIGIYANENDAIDVRHIMLRREGYNA